MCCGESRDRTPGKRGSGWVQESAEHVPLEILWSASGISPPHQPLGETPISPMPSPLWARHHYDHLYWEVWPTLCHSRVNKQTVQTHTGLLLCYYVDSSSPLGLVISQASSASSSLLALDGAAGRRCLLICPRTCMWFGNAAPDLLTVHIQSQPVLPWGMSSHTVWLYGFFQPFKSSYCVFYGLSVCSFF